MASLCSFAPAYARGETVEIARNNAHDVLATAAITGKLRDAQPRDHANQAPNVQ
jgi:predicted RNase H-like HicB family nuclease